ncbi:acyltransferase family protein [Paenibacillus sp. 22594]|uniref:acyltransferase family protein n=1 Tax=Paenibacillus sp. 22594 TaxID=3453947 RepID=UPI003F8532EF
MFLRYINNFRGIAIIMVLLIHTLIPFTESMNPVMFDILFAVFQDSTVLFVFISGFLFQHLLKKYEFKKYIKSKASYVLSPYLLLSIPGVIWNAYDSRDIHITLIIKGLLTGAISGTMGTYWFIPMIIIFFIASPLLVMIDNRPKLYYGLPLLFIVSTFITRDGLPYQNFVHFLPIYLFGMFASHFKEQLFPIFNKYKGIIFTAFLILLFLDIINVQTHYQYSPLGDNAFLRMWSKVLLCCLVINFLKTKDHILENKFDIFARYSFGLYFIQGYVITVLNKTVLSYFASGTILSYLLFSILTVAICLSILWLAKKILGRYSRYFIGI